MRYWKVAGEGAVFMDKVEHKLDFVFFFRYAAAAEVEEVFGETW